MSELMGYIAALLIGLSLGLIGGGGSILTVPVLVYLFGIQPLLAISYSLFVVGLTSLIGAFNSYRKGFVHLRTVFLFGITSIIVIVLTRRFLLPVIPPAFSVGGIRVELGSLTMVAFALLMLLSSYSMIKGKGTPVEVAHHSHSYLKLAAFGIVVGLITGFLGAGGGFVLIPALVVMLGMPMKTAVGTSLLIIALNSLVGFAADAGTYHTNWKLLTIISLIAILGVILGGALSLRIRGDKLKKGFGWFVLMMALYVLVKELLFTNFSQ